MREGSTCSFRQHKVHQHIWKGSFLAMALTKTRVCHRGDFVTNKSPYIAGVLYTKWGHVRHGAVLLAIATSYTTHWQKLLWEYVNTPCPEKNGTTSILGITLTNRNI